MELQQKYQLIKLRAATLCQDFLGHIGCLATLAALVDRMKVGRGNPAAKRQIYRTIREIITFHGVPAGHGFCGKASKSCNGSPLSERDCTKEQLLNN